MAVLTLILICALNIFNNVLALPNKEEHSYKFKHCIKMTPEREAEINTIVDRISNFLNDITVEFEHYDIRLIKLDIESHSEEEEEEKEMQLQLTVNDCFIEGNDDNAAHVTEEFDIEDETCNETHENNEIEHNNNESIIENQVTNATTTCTLDNESAQEIMDILTVLFKSKLIHIDDENVSEVISADSSSNNISTDNSTTNDCTKAVTNESSSANTSENDSTTG